MGIHGHLSIIFIDAGGTSRFQAAKGDEMHPHRVHSLIVAAVLILLWAWHTVALDHMRLAITIEAMVHFMKRQYRPV